MGILEQYEKEHGQSSASPAGYTALDDDFDQAPALIRWVMKVSGGSVSRQQASIVLLGISVAGIVLAAVIFFRSTTPDIGHDPLPPSMHGNQQ